jgi:hypothetical protein
VYVGSIASPFRNYSILDSRFSKSCLHSTAARYLPRLLFGIFKAGCHVLDLGVDEKKILSMNLEEV